MSTATDRSINLDGMSSDELRELCDRMVRFPATFDLHLRILEQLWTYAAHKAAAMDLRALGRIQAALFHERACEAAYRCLPEYARW